MHIIGTTYREFWELSELIRTKEALESNLNFAVSQLTEIKNELDEVLVKLDNNNTLNNLIKLAK